MVFEKMDSLQQNAKVLRYKYFYLEITNLLFKL